MTLIVTHAKVSSVPAVTPPAKVVTPTDWNANHAISGTADASQLNSNVVQSVTSDTNVTGSITAQNLTLGWTGSAAVSRGGTGGSVASGTLLDNITGFSATGLLSRTGAGTYAFRSVAGGTGISVVNGDGVAGNPTISTATTIDVYLVIGDSNAVGQGSSASSPIVPSGMVLQYAVNGTISDANDPTLSAVNVAQNANTGSMWPDFGIAYGRRVGLVLTGVGGSTQCSAADFHLGGGNWQDTTPGSNYANALAAINAGLAAYSAAGYNPQFRGIISILGTNDATQIDNSVIVISQFTAGFNAMAANFRAATIGGNTYPHLQIFWPLVGTNSNPAVPDTGYAQVRSAQLSIAAADGSTLIPFTDFATFNSRGLLQPNSPHATQPGYNIFGLQLGVAVSPYAAPVSYRSINLNAASAPLPGSAGIEVGLQVNGPDAIPVTVEVDGYSSVSGYSIRHAAGTGAAPTATQSGTLMGIYAIKGYGTTGYDTGNQCGIGGVATENHTDTARGSAAAFFVTPNGTTTPKKAGFFDQDGSLNVGLAGTYTAAVKLSGTTSGVVTAQVQAAAGTYNWNLPTGAGTSGQPLISGGGGSTPMSFGTLGILGGGTGVSAGGSGQITSDPITVDFSVAGDTSVPVPLPSNASQLGLVQIEIFGASANISTATFGVFTQTGGTGAAIVSSGTAITVTSTAINTNNNFLQVNANNVGTESYTPNAGTVQFRVNATTTGTAKVRVIYRPL